MEVVKIVERVENKALEEFVGVVQDVQLESNSVGDNDAAQYHITIKAEDIEVKGKTGLIHEWIRMSKTAKEDSIPQGSVIDRYLQQLEIVLPDAKKSKTLAEAFSLMKGKKFKFKRMKLGKAFEGHEARQYWVVISLVK